MSAGTGMWGPEFEAEVTSAEAAIGPYKADVIAGLRARGFSVEATRTSFEGNMPAYVLQVTKENFTWSFPLTVGLMGGMTVDRFVTQNVIRNWEHKRNISMAPETLRQAGLPETDIYTAPAGSEGVVVHIDAYGEVVSPGQETRTVPKLEPERTPGPVLSGQEEETKTPPNIEETEATLRDQIYDLAVGATGRERQNWDEWNWFYTQVTGHPGPAPEDYGIERTDPMPDISFSEWADRALARPPSSEGAGEGGEGEKLPTGLRALLQQLFNILKVLLYGRSS